MTGMEENAREFPYKRYETMHALEDGPDLWVHGSGNLIQTLLAHNLIDQMLMWTFPVTVGSGKHLFSDGAQADGFNLIENFYKIS